MSDSRTGNETKDNQRKVIDLEGWKMIHGLIPCGEWTYRDINTGEVRTSGPLYDHGLYFDTKPKREI